MRETGVIRPRRNRSSGKSFLEKAAPSNAFVRSARRFVCKHPQFKSELQLVLELLAADAFHPQLKSHKLKGKLAGSWACSAGYDLRIVFQFVKREKQECILLEGIGSHDEVY